jgi:cytochrome c-type biogenesis protein CcmE
MRVRAREGGLFVNNRLKRRLVVVTGIIVIVVVVVLAVVSATTASKSITVAEAASGDFTGTRVQVTGKVVDNSYSIDGNVLNFAIYDDTDGSQTQLRVSYDQGVSATFGNQVTAICTGVIAESGILECSELVTQCPSKYESSTDALTVAQLLSYGEEIVGKPVKVTGTLKAGSLATVEAGDRFVLVDAAGTGAGGTPGSATDSSAAAAPDSSTDSSAPPTAPATTTAAPTELPIRFNGALSDEIQDGSVLVVTGSLDQTGRFEATDVALKG